MGRPPSIPVEKKPESCSPCWLVRSAHPAPGPHQHLRLTVPRVIIFTGNLTIMRDGFTDR